MKPLPFIPSLITLTPAFQTYASIFIPRNTWGTLKILYIEYGVQVFTQLPNFVPSPSYTERYQIPGSTTVNRFGPIVTPVPPTNTWAWIQRTFVWDGSHIYEVMENDTLPQNSVSKIDGVDHRLKFTGLIAPFDPTQDNYLNLQMNTNYPTSTDTVEAFTGQAFIQSPLDLRRLTP